MNAIARKKRKNKLWRWLVFSPTLLAIGLCLIAIATSHPTNHRTHAPGPGWKLVAANSMIDVYTEPFSYYSDVFVARTHRSWIHLFIANKTDKPLSMNVFDLGMWRMPLSIDGHEAHMPEGDQPFLLKTSVACYLANGPHPKIVEVWPAEEPWKRWFEDALNLGPMERTEQVHIPQIITDGKHPVISGLFF